jgi:2-haloacid dehalogenase
MDKLETEARLISFQSANAWDAVGAASCGLTVAWVNRFGQRREQLPFAPDAELKSLDELPALLGL